MVASRRRARRYLRAGDVLIPFIAGQWSLRGHSVKQRRGATRLNPLHCGAVVASGADRRMAGAVRGGFQSPSLRGSGRFSEPPRCAAIGALLGFNPLHCGAVVASSAALIAAALAVWRVSIPFIAGQWSLLAEARVEVHRNVEFQSPSLRGSGRFAAASTS